MVGANTSETINGTHLPPQPPPREDLELTTSDGTLLSARVFSPLPGTERGGVLLASAMGVPQSFYAPFAQWLANEGFVALTFDYRGMGASRRGSLRDEDADIIVWAEQDAQAALVALRARTHGLPITWIGHSLGAQILPWITDLEGVTKIVTVAAGSGYWRENAAPLKRKVWLLWYLLAPALTPLVGYFPGKRLSMVGDLPRNVIKQWRRWCLQPDYALGDGEAIRARFASVTTPITSISFTDDEMMSEANTASLLGFYSSAPRTMRRWSPDEVGLARIGHFGFFRPTSQQALWEARLRKELATR